jgi:hypothetical protein
MSVVVLLYATITGVGPWVIVISMLPLTPFAEAVMTALPPLGTEVALVYSPPLFIEPPPLATVHVAVVVQGVLPLHVAASCRVCEASSALVCTLHAPAGQDSAMVLAGIVLLVLPPLPQSARTAQMASAMPAMRTFSFSFMVSPLASLPRLASS